MKMSDIITDMILDMFDDSTSSVQIQRNDLANRIGDEIDERTAKANLYNCHYQKLIDDKATNMMAAVMNESNFKGLSPQVANQVRAKQLKQMLLAYIN